LAIGSQGKNRPDLSVVADLEIAGGQTTDDVSAGVSNGCLDGHHIDGAPKRLDGLVRSLLSAGCQDAHAADQAHHDIEAPKVRGHIALFKCIG
jgi:hypothetical protein